MSSQAAYRPVYSDDEHGTLMAMIEAAHREWCHECQAARALVRPHASARILGNSAAEGGAGAGAGAGGGGGGGAGAGLASNEGCVSSFSTCPPPTSLAPQSAATTTTLLTAVGIWLHSLKYSFPHLEEMPVFETQPPAFSRPNFSLAVRGGGGAGGGSCLE
jgi:hypothetical protein